MLPVLAASLLLSLCWSQDEGCPFHFALLAGTLGLVMLASGRALELTSRGVVVLKGEPARLRGLGLAAAGLFLLIFLDTLHAVRSVWYGGGLGL